MNISLSRNSNKLNFIIYEWLRNCFSGLAECRGAEVQQEDARAKGRFRENKIFILDDLKVSPDSLFFLIKFED